MSQLARLVRSLKVHALAGMSSSADRLLPRPGDRKWGDVARTVPVDGGDDPWMVNLDVDSDGRIIGLEVLDASPDSHR